MTAPDLPALLAAHAAANPTHLRRDYEALARAGHHWAAGALLEANKARPGVPTALAYHGMSRHEDAIAALREGEHTP